jgi:cytochrome c oxidase cbb3-type subunit 1
MSDAPTKVEYAALSDFFAILGSVAGLVLGLGLAIMSADKVMAFHGLLLGTSCCVAVLFLLDKTFGDGTLAGANYKEECRAYSDNVIKAGVIATVFWGIAGFLVGDLIAWQLAIRRSIWICPGPVSGACAPCIPPQSSSLSAATR